MNDPIIGRKLGSYNVVELLGKGGMACVYRGFDAGLNRYAAVKVFEAHLIPEQEQDEYRHRFENEARAIARLRHPNIVGVYQFDQLNTTYYMAMEYVEGRDLRQLLHDHARANTRMAYGDIVRVIQDIGAALDYAHRQGVIHRDVKPSNIMVMPGGRAILTDFGLALSVPEGSAGLTFGSAHYIAPEQAVSSANAVPQSDLYSLGIVLFEMLTNRVPFNDPSAMSVAMQHLTEPPPPPSRFNLNLSQAIDHVVLKALSKEPEKRFASGDEMASATAIALAGAGESAGVVLPALWDMPHDRASARRPAAIAEVELLESWDTPLTGSGRSRSSPGAVMPRAVPLTAAAAALAPETDEPADDHSLSKPALPHILPPPLPTPRRERRPVRRLALAALGIVAAGVIGMLAIRGDTAAPAALAVRYPATAAPTQSASPVPTTARAAVVPAAITAEAPATAPQADAENSAIVLRYDPDSLVLLNRSDSAVDVSDLEFVQSTADGTALAFDAGWWQGGLHPTTALPAGGCFQVQRNDASQLTTPDYCIRQSWARVSFPRWFWTSDHPDAAFVVRRGEAVLATCPIRAGECALDLEASPR